MLIFNALCALMCPYSIFFLEICRLLFSTQTYAHVRLYTVLLLFFNKSKMCENSGPLTSVCLELFAVIS